MIWKKAALSLALVDIFPVGTALHRIIIPEQPSDSQLGQQELAHVFE